MNSDDYHKLEQLRDFACQKFKNKELIPHVEFSTNKSMCVLEEFCEKLSVLRCFLAISQKDKNAEKFLQKVERGVKTKISTKIYSAYSLCLPDLPRCRTTRFIKNCNHHLLFSISITTEGQEKQIPLLTVYPNSSLFKEEAQALLHELDKTNNIKEVIKLLGKLWTCFYFSYNYVRGAAHASILFLQTQFRKVFPDHIIIFKPGIMPDLHFCLKTEGDSFEDKVENFSKELENLIEIVDLKTLKKVTI